MHLDCLPNQKENEHVILFLRRHWFILFQLMFTTILMFILPLVLLVIFHDYAANILENAFWGPVLVVFGSAYFLSTWLLAFVHFTDYYLDTWIVSNERIINIEQNGLFNRTASEMHLNAIQDVTSEVNGFLNTFLNFGSVYAQTASERERFHFEEIPTPELVKEKLLKLVDDDKHRHGDHSLPHGAPGAKPISPPTPATTPRT